MPPRCRRDAAEISAARWYRDAWRQVPIVLEGKYGCLDHIESVLKDKGHAVVVVAEGAGEELRGASAEVDAGGNRRLPEIGVLLIETITAHVS